MITTNIPAAELRVGDVVSAEHVIGREVEKITHLYDRDAEGNVLDHAVQVEFKALHPDNPIKSGLWQFYTATELLRVTREDNHAALVEQARAVLASGGAASLDFAENVLHYFGEKP
jgi:hypothetical protein